MQGGINLRARILTPLALVLVLLFVLLAYSVHREETEHITREFQAELTEIEAVYQAAVDERAAKLGAVIEVLQDDPELQAALRHGSRERLLELSQPLFQKLRARYDITHFYFHSMDRICLLRVHQPEKYGDRIERHTAIEAEETGRPAHGIELGPLGTFTLRMVAPLYDDQRLIGYLELGEEIDALMHELATTFGVDIYVLIGKDYLVREEWEAGMRVLNRQPDWDRLPGAVIASRPSTALAAPVQTEIARWRPGFNPPLADVSADSQQLRLGYLGLSDARGRPVAALALVRDVTERFDSLWEATGAIGVFFVLLGGALVGGFRGILGRVERQLDDTQQRMAEESRVREMLQEQHIKDLEQLALYDKLTQLPNRLLLQDRLEHAIAVAHRDRESFALLLIDLHRLREINDTLGHNVGDLVLQQVAARLREGLRRSDTVARQSGVEFAVLMRSVSLDLAIAASEKIHRLMEEPFDINDVPLDVEVSVGIAVYPDHAADARTLLQRADVAMRNARRAQDGFVVYEAQSDPFNLRRLSMYSHLRRAIKNGELMLHYQPKMDMRTGQVTDVEALVRWHHQEHGFIPPGEFIPLVERTALVVPLTEWVVGEALRQCRQWRFQGLELRVSVNLSVRNLLNPHLASQIDGLLREQGVEPARLVLEITESAIMEEPERALPVLRQLDELGVGLSIDDFGTGYSSLTYLKRIPAEELKIDQSFVFSMLENENDAVIVRSTIDLAHNLGLKVVAEGVEDQAAWNELRRLGCDIAQGYYISRPVAPDDLAGWLQHGARDFGSEVHRPR